MPGGGKQTVKFFGPFPDKFLVTRKAPHCGALTNIRRRYLLTHFGRDAIAPHAFLH
jgi:hypothetical protein